MTVERLPIVGVMGSSTVAHEDLAEPLGQALAALPVHLLTGGGKNTMTSVCRAFTEAPNRRGLCVGVIPAATLDEPTEPRDGYPNPWVELVIRTHLIAKQPGLWDGLTRNHINILTSDVVIALPGTNGTRHELEMAVHYQKPAACFHHHVGEMPDIPSSIPVFTDLSDTLAFLDEALRLHANA